MRILIVEDEPRLRASLLRTLQEEGYGVDTAEAGDEGLRMAEATDYAAVVLDVMLPGLDGFEVLERLRRTKQTPVLLLTARTGTEDKVRGLDAGADDYLPKPFDLPELLARLRSLIRRAAGQPRPLIELGDVVLDLRARTVTRAGEPVALTAREHAILEYLALRRGEIVSRAALHRHAFPERDDAASNVVDVHVLHLRKKLGHDIITTRRGQGYCISR